MKDKKSLIDKQSSKIFVAAFAVVCLMMSVFMMTNNSETSYAADSTSSNTVPTSLTFSGTLYAGTGNQWNYISGLPLMFDFKATDTSGIQYDMYCIEGQIGISGNETYTNPTAMSDSYSTGLIWLLDNAYPNNPTSDYVRAFSANNAKKYVTQFAIWYYLDLVGYPSYTDVATGTTYTKQLTDSQKSLIDNSTSNYGTMIKRLANDAKTYNDTHGGSTTLTVDTSNIEYSVSEDGKYIESNEIAVNSNKEDVMKNYTVSVEGNEYDAVVLDTNGNSGSTLTFTKGSKFKIRVPVSKVSDADTFNLGINITANIKDKVYVYDASSNGSQGQRPIIVTDVTTEKNITLLIPLVKITKSDITNGKPVSGAQLTILDSNGNEVATWTTDENPHYVTLTAGNYQLIEKTSPDGYELNTEKIDFTVKGDGSITKVEMKNTPTTEVPDTAQSIPLYIYFIGLMIIVIGGVVIYETVKENQNS